MLKKLFKLDLRSLALARVLLGILSFLDLGRRWDDLETFYTDAGILSRADFIANYETSWRMTLLNLNGSYEFVLFLFILGMIASITLAVGWKTRISTIIVWLITISFHARFPEVSTTGGDMLLRIFLFWSFFLPMNAVYSFDRAVEDEKPKSYDYSSIFTGMWTVQVFLLYFFTFIYKWAPVYHTTFDAVWYMLQLDILITPFGRWLGHQYELTKVLTILCYALEIVGPLMLLIPWKRDTWRTIAVLSFWGFHLGIGATMMLGNFVPICIIIWVGLIPSTWWEALSRKINASSRKIITLYYDSESAFSKQLGLITREMLFLKSVKVAPAPSKALIGENELFVLEDTETKTFLKGLPLISKIFQRSLFLPVRLAGSILSSDFSLFLNEAKEAGGVNISEISGRKNSGNFRISLIFKNLFEFFGFEKIRYRVNKVEKIFGVFILSLIVCWNIEGVVEDREWYIGSPFDEVMFAFHLQQGWSMFAPHPQRSDAWWVMDGTLRNGKQWDALNNKPVSFKRPVSFYDAYSSEDWRRFLDNVKGDDKRGYLLSLGKYLCRKWNSEHSGGEVLQEFSLYLMEEWTKGPKEPPAKVDKYMMWGHTCF